MSVIRHVIVSGRVQGVGYRAWLADQAIARGLEGWVRNRRDGTVEAVFAGEGDVLGAMIDDCRRGPPLARVEAVDARPGTADDLDVNKSRVQFAMLPTV
ncbi:MAG: acylphosphatase [Proteobacteria bacterium SG_bin9]|nr:MAG: acylphosphatase [Proteobacteria bacterium SG_bin9]